MTLREATARLRIAGIEDAAGDAKIIFTEIGGIPREKLPFSMDVSVDDPELARAVERRENREPLQYILGKWWFWKSEFLVSPDCLIPRPETEMLVEIALKALPDSGRLLDLCTGSGCIALSVLAERPDVSAAAVDISPAALQMTEKNRQKLGVAADRFSAICADVTAGVPDELHKMTFDVIVANPPYIAESEMRALAAELSYEPRIALTDGGDGMRVISGIFAHYPPLLKPDGILAVEIGSAEGAAAQEIAKTAGMSAEVLRDLSGHDRVVLCRKTSA